MAEEGLEAAAGVSAATVGLIAYNRTDAGNADRLAYLYGDRIRYVYATATWLAWDGRRWKPDARGEIEQYARTTVKRLAEAGLAVGDDDARQRTVKFAFASEAAGRLAAMMHLARSAPQVVVTPAELDTDRWVLNVDNGTLDLRTGQLHDHDQGALLTKLAGAAFDPEAPAPRFEAFLAEVLPDAEVRAYLQRLVGYTLTGEVGENVLPFLYGEGANGKSVLLSALRAVLGEYATTAAPGLLEQRRERGIPSEIADLRGYRFVTAQEVEPGRPMATEVVKTLTGERELKARRLYANFETFPNVSTIWMAANDRPPVSGLDEALWRRIRLIPFDVVVPAERRDTNLTAKLLEERNGILAWAVRGLMAYHADGLAAPPSVLAATAEYRLDSNPLSDWLERRTTREDPDAVTTAADLRKDYEQFSGATMTARKFGAALAAHGLKRPAGSDDRGRIIIDGKQTPAYRGIRLLESGVGL